MGEADHRSLITLVRSVLDRNLATGARVVVAVSGGADSVALLHLCQAARDDLSLLVVYVRHGLRDDAADAAAAAANARLLDVPAVEVAVDVALGSGPEDGARRARYDALVQIAAEEGTTAVLVGHTADDQAETLLLRVARGTGPDGLAGMQEASSRGDVTILRPLLGLRRDDVRAVAAGLPTVEDPTNVDPDQRRSRARHVVLPALGQLRGDDGDPVPSLLRLADLARQQGEMLAAVDALAPCRRFGMAVVVGPHTVALEGDAFAARLIRRGWRALPCPVPPPSLQTVRDILALEDGASVDVPGGVHVSRLGREFVLEHRRHDRLPPVALPVGQGVSVPGHHLRLTVMADGAVVSPGASAVDLAMPTSGMDGILVRGRQRSGDRAARDALQRFPAPLRRHVPLICATDGTILMVADTVVRPAGPGKGTLRVLIDNGTDTVLPRVIR